MVNKEMLSTFYFNFCLIFELKNIKKECEFSTDLEGLTQLIILHIITCVGGIIV